MIIVQVVIFLLLFIGIKYRKHDEVDSYMDKEYTTPIIGVFALLIIIRHFSGYVEYATQNVLDQTGFFVDAAMGQLIVVPFLFFSGYGLLEQIRRRKEGYIRSIPKGRILKVYLMFFLAWIIFFTISFIVKADYDVKRYVLSIFGIVSIGNSNWYVVIILVLYFTTYLAFNFIKNERDALIANSVLLILLILILRKFDIDSCWWNTIPAYGFGLIYSYFKPRILNLYKKHKASRWILFIISIALTAVFGLFSSMTGSINLHYGMVISFCMIFACFMSLFKATNKITMVLGKYCFWIYILQRIPMLIFHNVPVIRDKLFVYFLLCVVVTGVLAFALDKLFNVLWKLLNKKSG